MCIHPVVPKHDNRTVLSILPKPLYHRHELYRNAFVTTITFTFRTQRRSVWVPNKYVHAGSKVISQVASTSTLCPLARPNIRYELRSEAYFQEVQTTYITFLSLTRRLAREARTVHHASSQTPTFQVQVSRMETEPSGTARLSLTLIYCV